MKFIDYQDKDKINALLAINQFEYDNVNDIVKQVIQNVKINKDQALFEYTRRFDNVELNNLKVTQTEIEQAYKSIDNRLIKDLEEAFQNIILFHKKQYPEEFMITNIGRLGNLVRPIETVGLYVPGGTAPYPSTVLMNAGPAVVAGVKNLVMVTPPSRDGTVAPILLAAAKVAGITEIYKVGGAQSIAALAFGTETIPKVDKIVGPGNIYVATAKKEVLGYVGIDMIAGPSEVLVIADKNANPRYIAADLLAQAEHDTLARTFLVTTSKDLANQVVKEISSQLKDLNRNEIASKSLSEYGYIVLVKTLKEAFEFSNKVAPEHLELLIDCPDQFIDGIQNAGAVFVGEYSPEPLGDYFAGPNHTLPTSGTARFASALSTRDFMKSISYISYSKDNLTKVKDSIIRIAEAEGLTAHANSIKVRYQDV